MEYCFNTDKDGNTIFQFTNHRWATIAFPEEYIHQFRTEWGSDYIDESVPTKYLVDNGIAYLNYNNSEDSTAKSGLEISDIPNITINTLNQEMNFKGYTSDGNKTSQIWNDYNTSIDIPGLYAILKTEGPYNLGKHVEGLYQNIKLPDLRKQVEYYNLFKTKKLIGLDNNAVVPTESEENLFDQVIPF